MPVDGVDGTLDPSRWQPTPPRGRIPEAGCLSNRPAPPPQPGGQRGYCPRGHPHAYSAATGGSYCPVCGTAGDWIPSRKCPHPWPPEGLTSGLHCGTCGAPWRGRDR